MSYVTERLKRKYCVKFRSEKRLKRNGVYSLVVIENVLLTISDRPKK